MIDGIDKDKISFGIGVLVMLSYCDTVEFRFMFRPALINLLRLGIFRFMIAYLSGFYQKKFCEYPS